MDRGPPPQYEQQQPPVQVIITHPTVLGPGPSRVTCPSCHAQVTTNVVIESSSNTHLYAILLCLICWPCMCVPYCTDSCKSKKHYCPNCQAYLGSFEQS